MSSINRSKTSKTEAKRMSPLHEGGSNEQRVIKPINFYSKVQKIFVSCATVNLLFTRPNPGYLEYSQNVLGDFEKNFDNTCNIKVSFFEDPKEPFKSEKCSHFAISKLKDQMLQRSRSIMQEDHTVLSKIHNHNVLLNAAKELTNILEVEKLEKQSGNWEMVTAQPVDKKSARQYRPKGQCLATLFSNKGKLTVLAQGKDKMFYSGSDQGEIRVFDFGMFAEENEPLLRSRIDVNQVNSGAVRPRRNSFSTCPDTYFYPLFDFNINSILLWFY
jgi:hypothetical protein